MPGLFIVRQQSPRSPPSLPKGLFQPRNQVGHLFLSFWRGGVKNDLASKKTHVFLAPLLVPLPAEGRTLTPFDIPSSKNQKDGLSSLWRGFLVSPEMLTLCPTFTGTIRTPLSIEGRLLGISVSLGIPPQASLVDRGKGERKRLPTFTRAFNTLELERTGNH